MAGVSRNPRSGLVFVKSGTCSALAGGLSIDDCFSATYNNYRIIVSGVCPASTTNFEARLRVSGTDATTAYTSQFIRAVSTTVTGGAGTSDPASAMVGVVSTAESIVSIDVAGPFLAQQTAFTATNGVSSRLDFCSAIHSTATSYTGLSFFPDVNQPARTLTITARVYGYANS